jgi:hypothetical protein
MSYVWVWSQSLHNEDAPAPLGAVAPVEKKGGAQDFSLLHSTLTGSNAHQASYTVGTGDS